MVLITLASTTTLSTHNLKTSMTSTKPSPPSLRTSQSQRPSEMFTEFTSLGTSSCTRSFSVSTKPTPRRRSTPRKKSLSSWYFTAAPEAARRSSKLGSLTASLRSTWIPTFSSAPRHYSPLHVGGNADRLRQVRLPDWYPRLRLE